MLLLGLTSLSRRLPASARRPPHRGQPRAARPLRVAIVTEFYYPHLGGVCEHAHFFARELRRRGHHADIVTSHLPGETPAPNVIRMGRGVSVSANGSTGKVTIGVGLRRQMRDVLHGGRYDIVHVHSPLTPTLPLLAVEEATCPTVATFHTDIRGRVGMWELFRGVLQNRLDRLDAKIAVSHAAREPVDRHFHVTDWHIIPNGIDVELFTPHAPMVAGFPVDEPVILFLHRLDPRNGVEIAIEAFRRVRSTGRKAHLVVVGDGPERERYHRMTVGDRDITFAGAVPDCRASYYAHSAAYICPCDSGSFGITLLEAMACATPIVCSDIPGFREVVAEGEHAFLVRADDPAEFAQRLTRLLDDRALGARMGASGREHALDYRWERVADAVLAVYRDVLGEAVIESAAPAVATS